MFSQYLDIKSRQFYLFPFFVLQVELLLIEQKTLRI